MIFLSNRIYMYNLESLNQECHNNILINLSGYMSLPGLTGTNNIKIIYQHITLLR